MDGASGTPWGARLLFTLAVLSASAAVVLAVTSDAVTVWIPAIASVLYLGVGLLGMVLTTQRPRNAVGWVMLAASLGAALLPVFEATAPLADGAGLAIVIVLDSLAAASILALLTLGVLLFPDGRPHGRFGRVLVVIACIALAMLVVGAVGAPTGSIPSPIGGPVAELALGLLLGGLALCLTLTVLAAVTATQRRRSTVGAARRAMRILEVSAWINAAAFIACAAISMIGNLPDWFGEVADQTGVVFAVAAWYGIVRYRLLDLRATLARTLPFLLASTLVIGVAALTAAVLGTLTGGWLGSGAGAVVAALIALLLRDQLQALANLLVYGRRVDPVTAHAQRLERALRDSHRLLVTARDDERRRIRRDLHDGLGPTLAGIVLGVETVERHLDDPDRARAELARLHDAGQGAVQEVRRIVYALRPPALDSLGLAGAIREQASRLGAETVDIMDLPELPESLEIGIYLIALEAMRNAATHARPGAFRVRLHATERLRLEVHDEGPGLSPDFTPGIGIGSMRERAAELGGTLDIRNLRPTGTLVLAEWRLSA